MLARAASPGDHPITRGRDESERINRVKTFTGQSLKGPPGSVSFLNFSATATVGSGKNQGPTADRSQGLALTFGQGPVVVLGEAAQLSAQLTGLGREPRNMMGMNVPGCDNRQMALNIMHWLSGVLEPRDVSRPRADSPSSRKAVQGLTLPGLMVGRVSHDRHGP
jgi:hypothetical protein